MPAHFTHIYAARPVADHLTTGEFPDWPQAKGRPARPRPGDVWRGDEEVEKFTAIGAIGPDLFYFNQDRNNPVLGPLSDVCIGILLKQ
jgi:hypothetical protein